MYMQISLVIVHGDSLHRCVQVVHKPVCKDLFLIAFFEVTVSYQVYWTVILCMTFVFVPNCKIHYNCDPTTESI